MGSDKGRFLVIFLLTMVVSHYGDDGRLDVTCGGWSTVQHPCSVGVGFEVAGGPCSTASGSVRCAAGARVPACQLYLFFLPHSQGVYIGFHTLDVVVPEGVPFPGGHLGVLFRKMGFWFMF